MAEQLGLDGTTTPLDKLVTPRSAAALTPAQRAILHHVRDHGIIRAVEAGRIVHDHRPTGCFWCSTFPGKVKRRARPNGLTCPYASSDGHQALKRLAARGFLRRREGGGWVSAIAPPDDLEARA